MSISSKSRRDARRRNSDSRPAREGASGIHAQLKDQDGRVLAGASHADGEWILVLRGEPVSSTDSAVMLLAMLRHVAANHQARGIATRLSVSKALDAAASAEAAAQGRTLSAHLDWLEAERRSRHESPAANGSAEEAESKTPAG